MKILWIAYGVLGKANELLYGKKSQGGGWIEESANHLFPLLKGSSLTIVSLGKENREIIDQETGILYVEYADVQKRRGAYVEEESKRWEVLIEKYTPDIIQVFGVEFSNGLNIIDAAKNIPVLFYIQGIMASFENYKYGGLSIGELVRISGLHALLKAYKFNADYKQYIAQMPFESEMIQQCSGIIVDGEWSKLYLQKYNREVPVYEQYLPVASAYQTQRWEFDKCEKNTIFTVAGRTPYKGLHNLVKALAIVKDTNPNIQLYIPGNMNYGSVWSKPPYIDYLEKLINKLNLSDNITFCGQLTPKEMAEHMLSANVFVMPSCIENHSSSLREAMYIGAPCISSNVGCIPEIARHGENLLLYRYPEIDQLAGHIIDLLNNCKLAMKLGENAYQDIRIKYNQNRIGKQIIDNYSRALSLNKKCVQKDGK